MQTDVIHYGLDLVDDMHQEFDEARGGVDENRKPKASCDGGCWADARAAQEKTPAAG
ncbi:hypothetical protein [Streptomyces sp. D2-8]|uniref:hypothetical protein n=1 Tax=Streptomyces sp. D2-8 TaxID=2707767 RepID=UPI0020BE720E|nr:hypothetical protein [Streptomyces sp. D2-8]